jgi:transcription elongation factor Elf1
VNAIKEISGTIEKLSEISSTIAAAVEEQGAATQEISRNVQQAAQGTQQVGRQQPAQAGSRQVPEHSACCLTSKGSQSSRVCANDDCQWLSSEDRMSNVFARARDAEFKCIVCNVKRIVIEVMPVARGYEMRSLECSQCSNLFEIVVPRRRSHASYRAALVDSGDVRDNIIRDGDTGGCTPRAV